jgi:hydrogenase expression/formation protein HypE
MNSTAPLTPIEERACSSVGIRLLESNLPLNEVVRGGCEILGLDPLYLANEGKLVAIVPAACAHATLAAMRAHPAGRAAAIIGEVCSGPAGIVTLSTSIGGTRVVHMLTGEQLPRICR